MYGEVQYTADCPCGRKDAIWSTKMKSDGAGQAMLVSIKCPAHPVETLQSAAYL
jgi:hypothetical protein